MEKATEKLLCKTFGATRIAYSMSDEQVEESHYKPGGTATSTLGHWACRVIRSGKIKRRADDGVTSVFARTTKQLQYSQSTVLVT
jgi:hypothetical protein